MVVGVTAGPPRTGGCSEHLLCAGKGAPETALQEVAGAVQRPRPSQASVTWRHSIRFQSPEATHHDVKGVTESGVYV